MSLSVYLKLEELWEGGDGGGQTDKDDDAVDILNTSRKGTAAMRPFIKVVMAAARQTTTMTMRARRGVHQTLPRIGGKPHPQGKEKFLWGGRNPP